MSDESDLNALLSFIDEIAPEHGRTSCNDDDLNGNQYFNEFGCPRCTRCTLLHRARSGKWPHGAKPKATIRYSDNYRVTER